MASPSCAEPDQDGDRGLDPGPEERSATTLEGPASTFVAPRHAASVAAAQQGYDEAAVAVPPPPPSTTLRRLRLSRLAPSTAELGARLSGMLAVMDLEIDPVAASAWAQQALEGERPGEASFTELAPGIAVTYDPWLDDLAIVDAARFPAGVEEGSATDEVLWSVAEGVMEALVDRGLLDPAQPLDEPTVSFVRSGVKGPDGSHEQWVDEVRFEANALVDGIPLLDAGLRLGITPGHEVSSLRIARIGVELRDPVIVVASEPSIRDSFVAHVAESTSATIESVSVGEHRSGYVLARDASSAVVEPLYLVRYAIVTAEGGARLGSRSSMIFTSLHDPEPSVVLSLP
ncbi:MAG: hypothetical protein KDK70_30385 [Myxococcales bacterium]|nr:hypothetical protein [Myxococcales bacterium]